MDKGLSLTWNAAIQEVKQAKSANVSLGLGAASARFAGSGPANDSRSIKVSLKKPSL